MVVTTNHTLITTPTPASGSNTKTMATISEKYIGDREVHTSPRGSKYIITDDGRKLYISKSNKTYRRTFTPPRGAFARFLNAQHE